MPKTSYIITTFVIILSCLLGNCSSKDPDRYYSKKDDFSIKLPKEWENKEGFMSSSVISLSPLENSTDKFRENVNVVVEDMPSGMELEEYFTKNVTNLAKFLADFHEFQRGTAYISEADAKWLIYSGKFGTIEVKNKVFFLVNGRRGYTITCSATPDGFARYKNKFEEIAQSFEFE